MLAQQTLVIPGGVADPGPRMSPSCSPVSDTTSGRYCSLGLGAGMKVIQRRRLAFIAALSLTLHIVVLAWLAHPNAPVLQATGPDTPLMSVELLEPAKPRRLPERAADRRDVLQAVAPASVVVGTKAPFLPASPGAPADVGTAPVSIDPGIGGNLRAALRAGAGCAEATSRAREEREACAERLGRLSAGAPSYKAPMDPGKRAYYDAVVAAGPSGRSYGDPKPGGATPDRDYFRVLNCSIAFGVGEKRKSRQGEMRLGRTPCAIPLQGSFFTPEASVRKQ